MNKEIKTCNRNRLLFNFILWVLVGFLSFAEGFSQTRSSALLDSLLISLDSSKDNKEIVELEIKISRELQKLRRPQEEMYQHAGNAVDLALNLKDTFLYARALDNLGLLYRFNESYAEALPLHIRAFELVESKDINPVQKMIFANNAGLAARYSQNYDSAIYYYLIALEMAEKENLLKNIAISSNGMGNTLGNIPGREEEAIHYFKQSLEAEKQRNNSLGIAMNYLSISDYYLKKKDFEMAKDYLKKLLAINREREDAFGLAITYEYMGRAYLEEGKNVAQSKSYFRNSLERFKKLNNTHKQVEIYGHLAKAEKEMGNLASAEKNYVQALELAKEIKRFDLLEEYFFALFEIMEKQSRFEEALNYYRQSIVYKDSLKINEQNVIIESLTRQYDLSQKENYIELLEKDKELNLAQLKNQDEKLKQRRLLTLFLGVALVLAFVIFLLQYRNQSALKKAQEQLMKEEKATLNAVYERNLARAETIANRLRINPHFLFNSLNAITYLVQSGRNEEAMKYLKVFSSYSRLVLETSTKTVIPLSEELEMSKNYMTLEENRFDKDFIFRIYGEDLPDIELVEIPPLLLQPFLENAIWHGLLPLTKGERILEIRLLPEEDKLKIWIDDNGVGRKSKPDNLSNGKHKSLGMEITQERIDLFNKSFGEKISYSIEDKVNENGNPEGTRVVIEMAY